MVARLVVQLIRRGRHNRMSLFWAAAIVALSLPWLWDGLFAPEQDAQNSSVSLQTCAVRNIYDGDTMTVICGGREEKIRLHCIDAPEMGQKPWGRRSRDHLRSITPSQVEIRPIERDRYGRLVGEVLMGSVSLNLAMVEAGQAAVYNRYCSDGRYPAAERQARQEGQGVWVEPGMQQRPWEWRSP